MVKTATKVQPAADWLQNGRHTTPERPLAEPSVGTAPSPGPSRQLLEMHLFAGGDTLSQPLSFRFVCSAASARVFRATNQTTKGHQSKKKKRTRRAQQKGRR